MIPFLPRTPATPSPPELDFIDPRTQDKQKTGGVNCKFNVSAAEFHAIFSQQTDELTLTLCPNPQVNSSTSPISSDPSHHITPTDPHLQIRNLPT